MRTSRNFAALAIVGALLIPAVPAAADAGSTLVDSLTSRLDSAHGRIDCLEDQVTALRREVRAVRAGGNGVATSAADRQSCPAAR